MALLLVAAIKRNEIPAVTATLGQVPSGILPRDAAPRVDDITLEDLVTSRAGLERTSGPNCGSWVASRNWLTYALTRPMVAKPGTRMLYSTGSAHIFGAALAEVTKYSLLEQARRHIRSD